MMLLNKSKCFPGAYLLLTVLSVMTAMPSALLAADDNKPGVIEEVVVSGVRKSLASAINIKRNADQVVDAISLEDMGKLPDNNIAEALQRITGIRITRDAGEGENVSIRGLSSELTLVTVNGNVMPSSNQDRQFSFDIVASELIGGLEVYKSPTAEMEEGGVGGVVNISLPRPLALGERFSFLARGQYNDFPDKVDPRISAFYSNTFAEDTFGIAVSALYSEKSLREDIQHTNYAGIDSNADGLQDQYAYASYIGWNESRSDEQLGLTLSLQWRPSDNIEARFNALYSQRDRNFLSNRFAFVSGNPRVDPAFPSELDSNGTFRLFTTQGFAVLGVRDFTFEEPLLNFDFEIDFHTGDWTITPGIQIADSKQKWTDPYQLVARSAGTTPIVYDSRADIKDPSATFVGQSVLDPGFLSLQFIDSFAITPADDDARSGTLDIVRNLDWEFINKVEFGTKYTYRKKDSSLSITRVRQDDTQDFTSIAGSFPTGSFFDGDSNFPATWIYPDFDVLSTLPSRPAAAAPAISSLRPPADELNSLLIKDELASFVITEKIWAAYAQTRFEGEIFGWPVRGNLGLRVVNTDQKSVGAERLAGVISPVSVERNYTDVLPSFNAAIEVRDDLIVRLAASKVMSRPTPADLSPRKRVETTTATPFIQEGDPNLDPFRATQFDISVEKYFGENGLINVGFFYKDIKSFITELSTLENRTEIGVNAIGNAVPVNADFVVTRPVNGDGGRVYGFEIGVQQSLEDILPGPFGGLGYIVNYTYADSSVSFPDQLNIGADIPLPDLSKHGYNLIGYYENDRFTARVAYNWRSKFMITPVRNAGLPSFLDDYGQVDASVSYNISDRLSIQAEGANLTNEVTFEYLGIKERSFRRYLSGRRFMFGIKYTM